MPRRKRPRVGRPKGKEPLSEKHLLAIEIMTFGKRYTQSEIAKMLGVSRMTLYKWRQRKDFDRLLEKTIRSNHERRMRRIRDDSLTQMALAGDVVSIEKILRLHGLLA